MKNFATNLALLLAIFLVPAYSWANVNYADKALWYHDSHTKRESIDVFYVLPTCVFKWEDASGTTQHNADPRNPKHVAAWKLSAELARSVFATSANLYLPYYRQSTFDNFSTPHPEIAMDIAYNDILDAFTYYINKENNGRPFVLAGYSQGAEILVRLLKTLRHEQLKNLVAAYIIGYGITKQDTMDAIKTVNGKKVNNIRLAKDATSTGVTICINSVADVAGVSPLLTAGNVACINPVTWKTDSKRAVLLPAKKRAKAQDKRFPYGTYPIPVNKNADVTIHIDKSKNVLVVDNVNPSDYFLPSFEWLFPKGNLHLQELFFYGDLLRDNVAKRSKAFLRKNAEQFPRSAGGQAPAEDKENIVLFFG